MATQKHDVFVTGGTGYIGRVLVAGLLARGHSVRGLVRPGSQGRLPAGAQAVVGDALDAATWAGAVAPADTLVHLVGTPHPNPWKGEQFRAVDLASIRASVAAAAGGRVRHLVYVSVAHPAPVMKAYVAARVEGEALVRASGLRATLVRPWYVLGPGHRWPYLLVPLYALGERLPWTAAGARRLGLVSRDAMVAALVRAVENPPEKVRVVEVPDIRAAGAGADPMVPLSPDTLDRLEALFAPRDRSAAARLLAERCGNNLPFCESATPASSERIRYAALKLSKGDLGELERAVELANIDWRDVLVAAGFGEDVTAHLRWYPSAGKR